MSTRIFSLLLALLFGGLLVVSAQESQHDIALTVYNTGAALIREQRRLTLDEGLNSVALHDIAATVDPSSVIFMSLSDPAGTAVLEQSYRRDTLDADALLAPYVAKTVEITISDGERFSGELLRLRDDKAILRTGANEIAFVSLYDIRSLKLPAPALDINPGPELRLLLRSESADEQDVELSYLAGGLNWIADYSVTLTADQSALDLRGMVTLSNHSGRAYQDAGLKLVAGEVSRIDLQEDLGNSGGVEMMMARSMAADESAGVEQRDLSEYKLYAIARPVSIADRETKQIEFVSGADIAASITYLFDSSPAFRGYYSPIDYIEGRGTTRADVRTRLEFSTDGESGLGADLPAGRVRVYQADIDGANLLIGEDRISHSPEGEDVTLDIGAAFDLTGERAQTDFSYVSRRVARESFEITLRNRKDDPVEIVVPERLYRWRDWRIIESSAPFAKVDNASIEFAIKIEPGAEATLNYMVEYSFPEEE